MSTPTLYEMYRFLYHDPRNVSGIICYGRTMSVVPASGTVTSCCRVSTVDTCKAPNQRPQRRQSVPVPGIQSFKDRLHENMKGKMNR